MKINQDLAAGTILSHYRIVSRIGAGGMGEVYLAQDTKLDRKVALKILHADVASNRNRMERFIREARATAALNHPHIAHWYEWDWVAAEREFRRAMEMKPDDPRPHEYYSWYLASMGRNDQAVAEAKRGQQLDPVSPEANLFLGSVLVLTRKYDEAIEQLRNTLELDQNYWYAHDFLGRAYEQKGRLAEAIAEFQRALELEKDNAENWSNLGYAYAMSGRRAEAQKIIEQLKEVSAHSYVAPYNFAVIYAGLGDKDQAFAWLDRAYADRSSFLTFFLQTDAHMDSLRSDPRFAELVRRVGLPQ